MLEKKLTKRRESGFKILFSVFHIIFQIISPTQVSRLLACLVFSIKEKKNA